MNTKSTINILAISLHICKDNNNTILETLLKDYGKAKLTEKQYLLMLICSQKEWKKTKLYRIMNHWIKTSSHQMIRQLIMMDF